LAKLGISASNQISSAFEKMGEPGKTLNATWQQIAALAKECEELNDLNGAYVGLLRQHVQRSLDALHDRPSQNLTYGPDGVGQRPTSTRKLLSV
jgi:flagellar biosynthesis/type III secretory pathway chaperone